MNENWNYNSIIYQDDAEDDQHQFYATKHHLVFKSDNNNNENSENGFEKSIKINDIAGDKSGKLYHSENNMQLPDRRLKVLSLGLLLTQQTVMPLLVRYSRIRKIDHMYLGSAAVVMNEVLKLSFCVSVLILKEKSVKKFLYSLYQAILCERMETLKVCVPSLLFIIQNSLYFIALSNLEPSTYLITYQLRILTTAFFFVTILHRSLSKIQWCSLVLLMVGVSLVQLQDQHSSANASAANAAANVTTTSRLVGFGAVLSMCLTSGFGGVYFEKVLKGSETNIWMQNIRLALLGVPLSLATMLMRDLSTLATNGMLDGFDWLVWLLTFFNALGGLVIATVMKYADNILKAYAQASAIIFAFLGSAILFNFQPTATFVYGAVLVIVSIYLYAKYPVAMKKV